MVAPAYPLQPHQATAALHTASGAHPLATFLNATSFWPTSNHRDHCFQLQEAETLVATINRHLESLGSRVPLQNDTHVTCMTDLVRHKALLRFGMHTLRNEHALWKVVLFVVLCMPVMYWILRIRMMIACMLVGTLALVLYDSYSSVLHATSAAPTDVDDLHAHMHAQRSGSMIPPHSHAAVDACGSSIGLHASVQQQPRHPIFFPCVEHRQLICRSPSCLMALLFCRDGLWSWWPLLVSCFKVRGTLFGHGTLLETR